MEKLPKRFKEKWVKALRSGKYKQGEDSLYDGKEDTYCCLGVACIITGTSNKIVDGSSFIDPMEIPLGKWSHIKVPKLVQGDSENPIVKKLSNYNDNGKSFNWIASYIDRYL